jgi:hypothetical protein
MPRNAAAIRGISATPFLNVFDRYWNGRAYHMILKIVKDNFWKLLIHGVFFAGTAVRLWFYLLNDSFWRDETKLLLNAAQKPFLDLLNPLLYAQESPISYLWFLRGLWLSGMNSEPAMRSASLLASLLSLYLFYRLLSRVFRGPGVKIFSLSMFAFSPGIILFAGLSKQYSLDILVAVVLLNSSIGWFTDGKRDPFTISKKQFLLAALAPWFSLPSIFIIMAICVGLALQYGRGRRHLYTMLLFASTVCISFLLEWITVLHRCSDIQNLTSPYSMQYAHIENWLWIFKQTFFSYTGPAFSFALVIGLSVAALFLLTGIFRMCRIRGSPLLALLLLPLLLAFGASLAKVYPVLGRNLLFAVPGIYLLIGYGIEPLFRSRGRSFIAGVALAGMLLIPCIQETLRSYTKPTGGVREAMKFIAERSNKEDAVFCDDYSASTVTYYRLIGRPYAASLNFLVDPGKQIEGVIASRDIPCGLFDSVASQKRIWLISETVYYEKENGSSESFQVHLAEFLKRFIGRKQIDYRFNGDDLSAYGRKLVDYLSARRTIIYTYATDRVQVYGFDKQRVPGEIL